MKKLQLNQMELTTGGNSRCFAAVTAGTVAGFLGGTGNGVAFLLGPIGVTWGAIGAICGAVIGAASSC